MSPIERANTIRQSFKSTVENVRNDGALSQQGKTQRLTEAYTQAVAKMAKVRSEYSAGSHKEYESLRKSVFGLSFKANATEADKAAAQSMYRDAIDRTAVLKTDQDALNMIETAHLTGDATLLRAASLSAFRNNWNTALNRYSEIAPGHAGRIRELQDAEGMRSDTEFRLAHQLAFNLQRPVEVAANVAVMAAD